MNPVSYNLSWHGNISLLVQQWHGYYGSSQQLSDLIQSLLYKTELMFET